MNIAQLQQCIEGTLNPDVNVRKAAEQALENGQQTPGFALVLLEIVAQGSTPMAIRQASAVTFKNLIKRFWSVGDDEEQQHCAALPPNDRQTIKAHLVQLMTSTPATIQAQLVEAIALIAQKDYPEQWLDLLPALVKEFNNPDMNVLIGILKTANSVFKSFRYVQRSDELYKVILYTLQGIQAPLLSLLQSLSQSIDSLSQDKQQLSLRLEALRLVCRIFYSLNYQDLPEFFEDHMKDWMTEFAKYLQYQNPILVDDSEEDQPSPLDQVQEAIIENLRLYADKDEEPFVEYLPQFTTLVWNLLLTTTTYPKHDTLATSSIRFLSSLIGRQIHRKLFESEETLRQIITKIVIPNLVFRESDEIRFEEDPQEYISTEVEGADLISRRRCAQELLKAMGMQFELESTKICFEHMQQLLSNYSSNPTQNWASKDAAIHLMTGVAVKRESHVGVSEVNSNINVLEFFQTHVLPELQNSNHQQFPVLKASCIKFVSTFRLQFPKDAFQQLFPLLIVQMNSPVVVVHSLAAYTVERILFSRTIKIQAAELKPVLESLFSALFTIIDNPDANENDYAMKCVMRSLAVADKEILAVTEIVLGKLQVVLERTAKNPRQPQYNHYLFESFAVLIKSVCSVEPLATQSFEQVLFGPFTEILQKSIDEFTPYIFQLLAQLLEYRPPSNGLGAGFMSLLAPLLAPDLWSMKGNIPALSRLVCAYIKQASIELVDKINPILGIFQKLVSLSSTENSGFEILNTSLLQFPPEEMQSRFSNIFKILLTRLQNVKRKGKYTRSLTYFFALFINKFGVEAFLTSLNSVQNNLGITIVSQVWIPFLKSETSFRKVEAKAQVMGLSKILFETPVLLSDPANRQAWSDGLVCLVTLLTSSSLKATGEAQDDNTDETFEEVAEYDAQFSQLQYARVPIKDPFPEMDPIQTFGRLMQSFASTHAGQLMPLIQEGLRDEPKAQAGLDALLKSLNITIS